MQSNWQADFFRGVALELWRRVTSPEQTRAEVDFLEKTFGEGGRFLDAPCGNGRHALEFARRGYSMAGVDSSEEFIREARHAGELGIEWRLGDMCDLPWTAEFDGAFCFGNSFGYLDPGAAQTFLSAIANALKPGARCALETGMAAESILPGLLQKRWHHLGELYVLSENQYHPRDGRLDIQYTFLRAGA